MIPDLDFVRALLLKTHFRMKGLPPGWKRGQEHTDHVLYLKAAGLANIDTQRGNNRVVSAVPTTLTPLGERLANAIRNDMVWARVKERLGDSFGHASIETIIDLAESTQRTLDFQG